MLKRAGLPLLVLFSLFRFCSSVHQAHDADTACLTRYQTELSMQIIPSSGVKNRSFAIVGDFTLTSGSVSIPMVWAYCF